MIKSNESEESLMMCGRDFESREEGAYVEEEKKVITNGDRFRAMTNEELAKELRGNCNHCALLREPCSGCECDEGILEYLNQEVTE